MSEQIEINLNDNTISGGGPSSERRSPRGTGATAPPEREGGVRVGATAQDQNFESLGEGVGKGFLSPPVLTFLSILADSSTTIRKLFLPLRKLAQVQQNVLAQNNKLAQRSNRNLKFNQTDESKRDESGTSIKTPLEEFQANRRSRPIERYDTVPPKRDGFQPRPGSPHPPLTNLKEILTSMRKKHGKGSFQDYQAHPDAKPPKVSQGKFQHGPLTEPATKKRSDGGVASVGKMGPRILLAAKLATGIGVALIGFKLGLDLVKGVFNTLNNTINAFIRNVGKYSGTIIAANERAKAAKMIASVREGRRSGGSAAKVIAAKSGTELAIIKLQATITNITAPFISKIYEFSTTIINAIEQGFKILKPFFDLMTAGLDWFIEKFNWVVKVIQDGINWVMVHILGRAKFIWNNNNPPPKVNFRKQIKDILLI